MTHPIAYLENLLETAFSANVAESEADQQAYLRTIATRPDSRQRDGLKAELQAALGDQDFEWDALFDRIDVAIPSGEPARPFVIERIWVPLFGRETIPEATG
jgi:hypothetical protein